MGLGARPSRSISALVPRLRSCPAFRIALRIAPHPRQGGAAPPAQDLHQAQAQALALWQSMLIEGRAPHIAMTEMYSKLVEMGLSFSDARWIERTLGTELDFHAPTVKVLGAPS